MVFPMSHGIAVSNPTSPSLRCGQNTSCDQADAHQQIFRSGAEQAIFSKPLINTDTGLHTEAVSSPLKEEKRPSVCRYTKYRKTTRTAASVLRGKVQRWRRGLRTLLDDGSGPMYGKSLDLMFCIFW